MAQVYENLCAEGLRHFITGFTLSGFGGHIAVLSSEGCEILLRNFQYVISGNNVAVCVCVVVVVVVVVVMELTNAAL